VKRGTLVITRAKNLFLDIQRFLEGIGFENVTITGEEKDSLISVIRFLKPKLVLVDSSFHYGSTPFKVGELLKVFKHLNVAVVSVGFYPVDLAAWFIYFGAKSYVSVLEGMGEFYKGLNALRDGRDYISPDVQRRIDMSGDLPEMAKHLTKRQKEIIRLLCNGFSTMEIADVLQISKRTVYVIKAEIYAAFCVRNENELIRVALFLEIIKLDELVFFGGDYSLPPELKKEFITGVKHDCKSISRFSRDGGNSGAA
jgi:DNA-binding NarL/FixJ family response regulator